MLLTENNEAIIPVVVGGDLVVLPRSCGDANADGHVNVSDAVYIINQVFKGGDPPVEPCCL